MYTSVVLLGDVGGLLQIHSQPHQGAANAAAESGVGGVGAPTGRWCSENRPANGSVRSAVVAS
jgi:hypothetical protein